MPGTPYVTPAMMTSAPTGADWNVVPFPGATTAEQTAELLNVCHRASGIADAICNQPLRCTLDVEQVQGPDFRLTVDASGTARVMLSRWPVTQVLAGRVSPRAVIPRSWSAIPVTAMALEDPPMTALSPVVEGAAGAGGQAVLIAPGYVSWAAGRNGYTAEVTYLNGWPHAGITAAVSASAVTVSVDDVTGMAGATCYLYDGADTETVTVSSASAASPVTLSSGATAQAGPGTLTLSSPLAYAHAAGTVISAFPQDIPWAVILLGAAQVLSEGATAVAIPDIAGSLTKGGKGVDDLRKQARDILRAYSRII